MHEAPVGWQCGSCVGEANRVSRARSRRRAQPGTLGITRFTPVVAGLIALNVAIFLWETRDIGAAERRFAMWPYGVHAYHQWYRLLTGAFLHANVEHILFNMVSLAIVGPPVEAEMGKIRFGVLYLLAALGGSVASYLLSPQYIAGIGASGAIFGVMGAYYVLAKLRGWEVRTITVLVVINLIFGFSTAGIDWRAHIGGLVTGVLVCAGLMGNPFNAVAGRDRPSEVAAVVQGFAVSVAALVALGLLVQLPPGHVNL